MTDLDISGFSTALYSTWFFVEPFKLLLDCGDGASALLGQKTRKVRTIAITHADRDHLTGLLQLNQLNARDGRDHLNDEAVELILSYSGDTPVGDPGIWNGSHVLIHEATFLTEEDAAKQHAAHSSLPALLDTLRDVDLGKVILAHFSARYRPEQVTETVHEQAKSRAFPHPIWVVPPHQVVRGILDGDPVWRP